MISNSLSRRPRPPRHRSEYRNVAELGDRAIPAEIEAVALELNEIASLTASLGAGKIGQADLAGWLNFIATQHRHWRKQKRPSRAEAAYQIKLLVHLAQKLGAIESDRSEVRQELLQQLRDLNDLARGMLWRAIESHGDWPKIRAESDIQGKPTAFEYLDQEGIDFHFIGKCAGVLLPVNSRGDYSDPDLALTIAELVGLYEDHTAKWATYSTWGERGSRVKVPESEHASPCSLFVAAFFEIVDPDMAGSKGPNALKAYLAVRRNLGSAR